MGKVKGGNTCPVLPEDTPKIFHMVCSENLVAHDFYYSEFENDLGREEARGEKESRSSEDLRGERSPQCIQIQGTAKFSTDLLM